MVSGPIHIRLTSSTLNMLLNVSGSKLAQIYSHLNVVVQAFLTFSFAQGHEMKVVEADGHYIEPVEIDNLGVYSILIKANQGPSQNYWMGVNVKGREPKTSYGLAILNYLPNPSMKVPTSPLWNDYIYNNALTKTLKGCKELPPLHSHRRLSSNPSIWVGPR
ncbi:hypothetical protein SUGI_0478450, partial [Cryptomeria japonica]